MLLLSFLISLSKGDSSVLHHAPSIVHKNHVIREMSTRAFREHSFAFSINGPEVEITCDDRNHVNFILLSVVSLSIFTTEVQNLKEHFK